MGAPYRTTPVFDERTLPEALRRDHRTKAGVWGVIRVLEGALDLTYAASGETVRLTPTRSGLVRPEETHFVAPVGVMQMQVAFYDHLPEI